jgi:hypothetical protein
LESFFISRKFTSRLLFNQFLFGNFRHFNILKISLFIIKKTIDKFHSLLEQNATNDAEKLKLINKLVDTLRQIKSKSCCVSLINMLVQSSAPSSLPDKTRLIDFKLLVDTFLRLINTKSENSTYCIHSLTQLLIENKTTCIKYYSIRNPSHPFIEILRNATQQNAENLNTILVKQLDHVYEANKDTQDEATLLMKPFFIHVFIETTSSYKHLIAKFLLQKYMDNWSKLNGSLLSLYVTNLRNDEMGSYLFLDFLNEYMKCLILRENNVNCFLEIIDLTKYLIKIDRIFNYNCSNEWKMLTECMNGKTSFEQNQLMEILAENLSLIGNVNLKVFIFSFIDFSFLNQTGQKLILQIFEFYFSWFFVFVTVFRAGTGTLSWCRCR